MREGSIGRNGIAGWETDKSFAWARVQLCTRSDRGRVQLDGKGMPARQNSTKLAWARVQRTTHDARHTGKRDKHYAGEAQLAKNGEEWGWYVSILELSSDEYCRVHTSKYFLSIIGARYGSYSYCTYIHESMTPQALYASHLYAFILRTLHSYIWPTYVMQTLWSTHRIFGWAFRKTLPPHLRPL